MSTPTTDAAKPQAGPARSTKPQPPSPIVPSTTSAQRQALAQKYGLRPLNVRPPLREYIRELSRRRSFIRIMATSTAYARNQRNYLGQLWAILNPVLNAAMYVLVFGLLLGINRGLDNTIAFIVIGTFMFRFFEASVSGGSKSISGKTSLLRSLHFPRAVLPISSVLSQLATLLPAIVVMCGIALISGLVPKNETIHVTWWWLMVPVVLTMMWVFNTGVAFIMARLVASTPDLDNIISFVMRLLMFGSGVIFPVSHYVDNLSIGPAGQEIVSAILNYQPVAVYLYLMRSVIAQEEKMPPDNGLMWAFGGIWAVVFFVVGFIVFWRGEEKYGRD